jgi:hypothetical protein
MPQKAPPQSGFAAHQAQPRVSRMPASTALSLESLSLAVGTASAGLLLTASGTQDYLLDAVKLCER